MLGFRSVRPAVGSRLLPVVALCAALGCGSNGSRVSGKITFQGKPVPAGKIYFTPDGSKGNTGQTGYATITDGTYDTSASGGMEVGQGPMIVAIEGLDPSQRGSAEKGDTSGEETVKALFARYETTLDVSGNTTKDFDVPASAANQPTVGERPMIVP